MTDIQNDYFEWLLDIVKANDGHYEDTYYLLLKKLHKMPFYDVLPNDDNRTHDGYALRLRYADENILNNREYDIFMEDGCSVLEMMIALAERIDGIMYDLDGRNNVAQWFWEMIENLGLDCMTDYQYCDYGSDAYLEQVVLTFLDRRYKRDGRGGLFPLESPASDQRKVEIWYQMQAYLDERYGI